MPRSSIHLRGFDELQRNLASLSNDVATRAGQSAVTKGAQVVARAVKAAAPVGGQDTSRTYSTATGPRTVRYGRLRDNIRVRRGRSRNRQNVSAIVSTGRAFWARFLEYGTRKMSARPFFKPAMDGAMDAALDNMRDELAKAINRIRSRGGVR